jgi:hypothetical protein
MSNFETIRAGIYKLFSSKALRMKLSLTFGALLNFIYIAGNIASALLYQNLWSATLPAYHLVMITIRLYLLSAARNSADKPKELRICHRVGVLLLLSDLAAAFIIIYTLQRGAHSSYSGVIFLGILCFSVYSLTSSIMAIRRHRGEKNYLHMTARTISLSTALMSIYNLLHSFFALAGADFQASSLVVLLAGVGVFSAILVLSLRLMCLTRQLISTSQNSSKIV